MKGGANVLIFPDPGSANIAFKLLAKLGGTERLGPIPMGVARPVHLLPRDAEVELIVKVAAIAVVDAQETEQHGATLERTKALVPANLIQRSRLSQRAAGHPALQNPAQAVQFGRIEIAEESPV